MYKTYYSMRSDCSVSSADPSQPRTPEQDPLPQSRTPPPPPPPSPGPRSGAGTPPAPPEQDPSQPRTPEQDPLPQSRTPPHTHQHHPDFLFAARGEDCSGMLLSSSK
ncbi:unnamed protein product [Merluccius merluccius]